MSLSANTLFHFTKDLNTLTSILRSRIFPRACLESQLLPNLFKFRFAVPMASFCDIPLSQIREHTEKYGNYAIGLKKEWAIQQGVTPVLYVHSQSVILQSIMSEIERLRNTPNLSQSSLSDRLYTLLRPVMMMKPYEEFDDRLQKIVRYYDEREWRYVPPQRYPEEPDFLLEDFAKSPEILQIFNTAKEKYGVVFNPDVINYIIVKREDEVLPLKREIVQIKGKFSFDSVELLTTRILSMERILQDM